jgi:hypothetical protein
MKIGQSDSIEAITPAHWQKMAHEARLGWPMLRERIVELCHKTIAGLQDTGVRSAANNDATIDRVAGIIEKQASSLLQKLT